MQTLVLAGTNAPAVVALVNVLWNACTSTKISSAREWPFSPDSLDFSAEGDVAISVTAAGLMGRRSDGPIVLLVRDGDLVEVPLSLDDARFVRDRLSEYLELSRVSRSKELPIRRASKRAGR
jgi:hypothetical protein